MTRAGGTQMIAVNDGQIASISLAASTGEIEQSRVAVARSSNADVRSLAQDLVTVHTAAIARERALAASSVIIPAEHDVSQTLQTMSRAIVARLQNGKEWEFDQMYLSSRVDVHQMVLTLIDETLLPQVEVDALREELMSRRVSLMQHLERARELLAMHNTGTLP